jgi:hypothetical protein
LWCLQFSKETTKTFPLISALASKNFLNARAEIRGKVFVVYLEFFLVKSGQTKKGKAIYYNN